MEPPITQEGFKRKLNAILSADVIGYIWLMRDYKEATVRDIVALRVFDLRYYPTKSWSSFRFAWQQYDGAPIEGYGSVFKNIKLAN